MAACLRLSTARVYFSVCFNPLCPKRLATVFIFAPLLRILTAKEWRPQCHVICFSMPALLVQCRRALRHIVWLGKGNIKSLGAVGTPISLIRPSFRGITTPLAALCPFVLFCSNLSNRLEKSTLEKVRSLTSQNLKPQ